MTRPSLVTPYGLTSISNSILVPDTSTHTLLSYTPDYDSITLVLIGLEVIIQSTIDIALSYTSPVTGSQTYTWENDVIAYGPRFELPVTLIAKGGTSVDVTIQSGTANSVNFVGVLMNMLPMPINVQ